MTLDFLLAKLKTLARQPDGVAWEGVEDDLRAFERTVVVRCADAAKKLFGHPPVGQQVADAILATLPGSKGGG